MSEENVEVVGEPVRRLWAALSKRDWAAFSAELDPEMEYTPVEEQVTAAPRQSPSMRRGGLRRGKRSRGRWRRS